jgi:hypothetical protein
MVIPDRKAPIPLPRHPYHHRRSRQQLGMPRCRPGYSCQSELGLAPPFRRDSKTALVQL